MIYKKVSLEEVKQAFTKLQSYVYFDNYDLILRGKIATFKRQLLANLNSFINEFENETPFERLIKTRMKLSFLPKKMEPQQNKFPSNYYTNTVSILGNRISQPNIHCDFPVELHLIATIWLMRYGAHLERTIPSTSYGNRLIVDKDTGKIEGRSLFKPYFRQFQNWWSKAINETKQALKDQQSVTILNFDLKSFYHEVNFNFDKLEERLLIHFPKI